MCHQHTVLFHYTYSLHPKWCCAHFCYLFTELNSIQITYMEDDGQDNVITSCKKLFEVNKTRGATNLNSYQLAFKN